jgi:hypothetical protein
MNMLSRLTIIDVIEDSYIESMLPGKRAFVRRLPRQLLVSEKEARGALRRRYASAMARRKADSRHRKVVDSDDPEDYETFWV